MGPVLLVVIARLPASDVSTGQLRIVLMRRCQFVPKVIYAANHLLSDSAVLSRLDDVEHRIRLLESTARLADPPVTTLPRTIKELEQVPGLHTAAAHKMLSSWPRLRGWPELRLDPMEHTLAHVDPSSFLQEAEWADDFMELGEQNVEQPNYKTLHFALQTLYEDAIVQLPLLLSYTLLISPSLRREVILDNLRATFSFTPDSSIDEPCDTRRLSTEQLLVCSISLRLGMYRNPERASSCLDMSKDLLVRCMQRHWSLHSRPDSESVPVSLALSAYLLFFWDRPFQAIGILNSLVPALNRLAVRSESEHDEEYVFLQGEWNIYSQVLVPHVGCTAMA